MANYRVMVRLFLLICVGFLLAAIVPAVRAENWGWIEQVKLTASDGTSGDNFGRAVSVSGDYAVVGAWEHEAGSGSAYIFKKRDVLGDPNWYQQCKLTASDGAFNDQFGYGVSIDGDYAVVGAAGDDDNGDYSGSAYIFKKSDIPSDPNWYEQCKLLASDVNAMYFGRDVSIYRDYVVVGAFIPGSAYVFKKSDVPGDPNWYEQCKLTASDGDSGDYFGRTVSVDSDYAVVGALLDEDNGIHSGSAYIFKKSDTPGDPNWYEQCKLLASDGAYNDQFSYGISISGDYAVVGAYLDNNNGADSGSAYIFKKSDTPGDPNWYEQCKLLASDGAAYDQFGVGVSVDGDYSIIGAFSDDDNGSHSGSAYIFKKSDTPGDPNWYEQFKLIASDGTTNDSFGNAVSLSDGYAIIGARGDDDHGIDSGSAYVFKLTCPPADLDGNCYVDFDDFAVFSKYWLKGLQ